MAAPRLALAGFVLLLAVITVTEGLRGSGPRRCCTRFNKRQVQQDKVLSYTRTSQRCAIPGVFLKTVGGNTLCARSSVDWVKDLIRHLDAKSAHIGETSNL
ncbi:monocyte chemotactic protein 1B-like [Takifugu rubripes]|uniref:Monocyte chemotactic protein 1B-like n=1 Tax=Takifugu rubripes TaxID=31033 RepID=A0A3B5KN56_TAKRU|nr:monocyte chemotactic protein 1B-like [Takifugu rubripes]